MPRHWRLVALGLSLTVAAAACTNTPGPAQGSRGGSIRLEGEEPVSLDPAHADDPAEVRIVRHLFRGLVQFDERQGRIVGASASEWEVSPDATSFTFTLRRDDVFSNGEPVKAENFVRAFERATARAEASPVAHLFSTIRGFAERHDRGIAPELAGMTAVDDYTLRIELSTPDAEFVTKLTHPAFSPVPSDAAMLSVKPFWSEAPIGNGPWKLKEPWKHNESIVLERNPGYTGTDRPNLDEAVFVLLDDVNVSYEQWLAGNLDWSRIPDALVDRVRAENASQTVTRPSPRLVFLIAFPGTPPTNAPAFRQAISLAIDRADIGKSAAWRGLASPATAVVPQSIPGYRRPGDEAAPCQACRLDAKEAPLQLKESGVRLKGPLELHYGPVGDQQGWVVAVAASIKQHLGIDVKPVVHRPLSDYVEALRAGRLRGLAAFETTLTTPSIDEALFGLFHSSARNQLNLAGYVRRDVDGLIDAARAEPVDLERLELYQEAEDRILQDLPIIPLWWPTEIRLARPSKFGGLQMDLFGDPTITTAFLKR